MTNEESYIDREEEAKSRSDAPPLRQSQLDRVERIKAKLRRTMDTDQQNKSRCTDTDNTPPFPPNIISPQPNSTVSVGFEPSRGTKPTPRRFLSDILHDNERDRIAQAWEATEAAEDFAPLPGGTYVARIIGGELSNAKTGTPRYKLTFRVLEGDHQGRQFWCDIWLTEAALPMAKRDLGKLGVTQLEQLDNPLPAGIRCKVKLALRKDDDGTEYNRVRSFEVLGIDEPEPDAFAPEDPSPESGDDPDNQTDGGGDTSFDTGQLEPKGGNDDD